MITVIEPMATYYGQQKPKYPHSYSTEHESIIFCFVFCLRCLQRCAHAKCYLILCFTPQRPSVAICLHSLLYIHHGIVLLCITPEMKILPVPLGGQDTIVNLRFRRPLGISWIFNLILLFREQGSNYVIPSTIRATTRD